MVTLDQIVLNRATQPVEAAIKRLEHVTLDVIPDGKDSFVTKVYL